MEAEGPFDGESHCSDIDMRELIPQRDSDASKSLTSSMGAENGSPVMIEDLWGVLNVWCLIVLIRMK